MDISDASDPDRRYQGGGHRRCVRPSVRSSDGCGQAHPAQAHLVGQKQAPLLLLHFQQEIGAVDLEIVRFPFQPTREADGRASGRVELEKLAATVLSGMVLLLESLIARQVAAIHVSFDEGRRWGVAPNLHAGVGLPSRFCCGGPSSSRSRWSKSASWRVGSLCRRHCSTRPASEGCGVFNKRLNSDIKSLSRTKETGLIN